MTNELNFECTSEIRGFVDKISTTMTSLFFLPAGEAIGRINKFWKGQRFLSRTSEITLFHESPEYWAKTIYYGQDKMWWLGEEGLTPTPYP
jgi:hypothetical protein